MDEQTQPSLYLTLTEELGLSEREVVTYLTPTLADLSRRIGLQATLLFLDRYHNRLIYVPGSAEGGSALVEVLGKDAVEGVIDVLGGNQKFDVSCPFGQRFKSRMRALKAFREGKSLNEVAELVGNAKSTLKRWKRDAGLSGVIKSERREAFVKRTAATTFDVNAHMLKMRDARSDRLSGQRKQAFEMLFAGRRLVDIQRTLGVSYTTVKKWRKQYGAQT